MCEICRVGLYIIRFLKIKKKTFDLLLFSSINKLHVNRVSLRNYWLRFELHEHYPLQVNHMSLRNKRVETSGTLPITDEPDEFEK